jgi:outer membrane protein OmpA-like peptidoglycan-associated protein
MSTTLRSLGLAVGASVLFTVTAAAQSNQASSSTASSADNTRPATTTFLGDTGLWFVPTGEVLPDGMYSVSGYRRGTDYIQGYSNIADWAGTFAYGIKGRAEIFGSILFDTAVDRDVRPMFYPDATFGGFVDSYPRVHAYWTHGFGDIYLGAKINFMSEAQQKPAAVAVRFMVKLPTANSDSGLGTGKADFLVHFIVSKELQRVAELSGFAGYDFRGQPDQFSIPGAVFQYGVGAGFPSRSPLRVTTELNGIVNSSSTATFTGTTFPAPADGSLTAPLFTVNTQNVTRVTLGLTYQAPKGFFVGFGGSWNVPTQTRVNGLAEDYPGVDYWDWQLRIGYHPGVRKYVPPPPPPTPAPAPAPAPAPPPTHNLSVRAQADPSTVEVGRTSTVTATVTSSINCAVTYRWTAPTGTFANPTARQTVFTAPNQEGAVPVTVTVTCPTDQKTASDTVTIQVTRPPVVQLTFDDVYFDFDRSTLRPEALRILDDAVTKLQANPGRNVVIEGHTCSIGTAEYNLALGERRAASVRDYLISRGVPAARLQTRSYGEENPKYDNSREETRRLNRRAALTVSVQ